MNELIAPDDSGSQVEGNEPIATGEVNAISEIIEISSLNEIIEINAITSSERQRKHLRS